jgi:hypothetical protein
MSLAIREAVILDRYHSSVWLIDQKGASMRLSASTDKSKPNDIGTLWTMRRFDHVARCALFERLGQWEVRVLVDGIMLHAERCPRGAEAFALADRWKERMLTDGWRFVRPTAAARVA